MIHLYIHVCRWISRRELDYVKLARKNVCYSPCTGYLGVKGHADYSLVIQNRVRTKQRHVAVYCPYLNPDTRIDIKFSV